MKNVIFLSLSLAFSVAASAQQNETEKKDLSLTIYNQNRALVRDTRQVSLKTGKSVLRFADIASGIDATSVRARSVNFPKDLSILEQDFEYDLVNSDKLLQKYVDKEIKVMTKDNNLYEGTLSSYDGAQLVLTSRSGPVYMINRDNVRNTEFPRLPEGLITKPTLVWSLLNERSGKHDLEVSYLTSGIGWRADYVAAVSEDEKGLSLNAWVTIDNNSGAAYENAALKLIAGDVNVVQEQPEYANDMMFAAKSLAAPAPREQFKEKSFFEYHMYTLQRRTTLKNNQTKQVSLLQAPSVTAKKIYTYNGALYRWYYYNNWQKQDCNKKVNVKLEVTNSRENGLGMPLPKGKVRVYKADEDKALEFIGEDAIDHTAKDEKVTLYLGDAFDITGERKITNHTVVAANIYRDTYEITLKNHKKEAAIVRVEEKQWGDWQIIEKSRKFIKEDANTLVFEVEIPADGRTQVSYTAEYRF